jgi:hypothetical protein
MFQRNAWNPVFFFSFLVTKCQVIYMLFLPPFLTFSTLFVYLKIHYRACHSKPLQLLVRKYASQNFPTIYSLPLFQAGFRGYTKWVKHGIYNVVFYLEILVYAKMSSTNHSSTWKFLSCGTTRNCNLVKSYRSYWGTCCHHLHDIRVSKRGKMVPV